MHVEEKGIFFQSRLGMRAGRLARVWKCIHTGKHPMSTRLAVRREAVFADLIVERSALRELSKVSY